ncbi:MAG: DUF2796 domain-containing protein [Alcanivorax sp.]|nr:DUF2796 domain-containing protein [Alcanivorax sp.]
MRLTRLTRIGMALTAAVLCALLSGGALAAGDGDRRDAGRLELALHGQALVARLTLPAVQVVGFERAPANDDEKMAVTEALQRLGEARNVLEPMPEALCTVTREQADTTLTTGNPTPPVTFQGRYAWRCENPDALLGVDIPLLEFVNGVPLETLVVGPDGDRSLTVRVPQTRIPIRE